jgi:hypothetical protein
MLKHLKQVTPDLTEPETASGTESDEIAGSIPAFQEDSGSGTGKPPSDSINLNRPAFVNEESQPSGNPETTPEIENALRQIKSMAEYYEDIKPVSEKFQGTAGPDYLALQDMMAGWISAGYILQAEEYTPAKVFGKPEVKFTFAKPKSMFLGHCHEYPCVCSRYVRQSDSVGFDIDNLGGQRLAYAERSLGQRTAGLDLLRVFTPDHNRLRYMANLREMGGERLVIDLFQGERSRKIGEILRDSRQPAETVSNSGGKTVLHLVNRNLKDLKQVVYSIQKDTSLLRFQTRSFDFFSRDVLFRVGDPHRLSEDEEALILMTGLLAVDFLI